MGTRSAMAADVQKQVIQTINQRWWIFLLGEGPSYPEIIRRIMRRFYPQDDALRPWIREWVVTGDVGRMVDGDYIHIVALDPQYASYEQIDQVMQGRIRPGDAAEIDPGSTPQIFVPIHVPDEEGPDEAHIDFMNEMRQRFDAFLNQSFSPKPVQWDGQDGPVIWPQMIGPGVRPPELLGVTQWCQTGDDNTPLVRFTAWLLAADQGIKGTVVAETRNRQDLIEGSHVFATERTDPLYAMTLRNQMVAKLAECMAEVENRRNEFFGNPPPTPNDKGAFREQERTRPLGEIPPQQHRPGEGPGPHQGGD